MKIFLVLNKAQHAMALWLAIQKNHVLATMSVLLDMNTINIAVKHTIRRILIWSTVQAMINAGLALVLSPHPMEHLQVYQVLAHLTSQRIVLAVYSPILDLTLGTVSAWEVDLDVDYVDSVVVELTLVLERSGKGSIA